jgi:hypothetical protein
MFVAILVDFFPILVFWHQEKSGSLGLSEVLLHLADTLKNLNPRELQIRNKTLMDCFTADNGPANISYNSHLHNRRKMKLCFN